MNRITYLDLQNGKHLIIADEEQFELLKDGLKTIISELEFNNSPYTRSVDDSRALFEQLK